MSKASDNVFPRFLISEGGSTATPAAGRVTVYAKADGLLYSKDDAGVETLVSGGSGGVQAFGGALAYNSTTQSINNDTLTLATLDSEDFDTATYHSTVTNTDRMTVPSTGKYRFTASVFFATASATGIRFIKFEKNHGGTPGSGTNLRGEARTHADGTNTQTQTVTVIASLTAGDYVSLIVYQNSGSAMNIGHATAVSTQTCFSVELLGT